MKLLITGATGLVGKALVNLCLKEKIPVHYLTTSKSKITSTSHYKGFFWNPEANDIDLNCFEGVTAIVNLAGSSISKRWTSDYKKEILNSRISSLRTLYNGLEQVKQHKVDTFVSASAVGIYPNSLDHFYTEDETLVDNSFLGEVVEKWEAEADRFNNLGLSVAKIRIGLVLSLQGGALPEIDKTVKYFLGAAFGSGEQWQSWIHIEDLAQIFLFVIKNKLQGNFNGVSPNPVTNNKLTKQIAKMRSRPLCLPNVPEFVMKTVLGEMSYVLFASQRVSSKKIEEEGFVFNYPNVCVALEEIYAHELSSTVNSMAGHT